MVSVLAIGIGAVSCLAGQNVPALKDVFKDTFLIGGALNRPLVTGQDPNAAAVAAKHFNTATPENDLKWQLVHPQPNQYNWAPADSFMAFCEKNQIVAIGHTLVWHAQTPRWVFQDDAGGTITRDALLARLKDHITTVVGHYKGRIKGWDVVNEALEDNGRLRPNSPWVKIIGEGSEDKKYDFIESAFRWAHEADPDAELYYNDYNLDTSKAKADAAAAIVKHLQSKGVRIDGVGIQLHGGLTYPRAESLDYAITALAATGVKVMITELDIKTQTRGPRGADVTQVNRESTSDATAATAETQKKLADKYAEIFAILVKHKKDISRVTFWGVYDKTSWIGGSPLLFDRDCQPKEAFFAVVKTVQSAASPETAVEPAKKFVLRVDCGASDPFTDKQGNVWAADQEFEAGKTWGAVYGTTLDRPDVGITGTEIPRIYETERYSVESYKFTVPNGKYTVRLHFAETFDGITEPEGRVFSVSVSGQEVLKDLDLYKTVGPLKPLVKEYKGVSVEDGPLVIGFTPNIENPQICGIEILAE
jgi:endo-1,4-beta-xylanase